MSATFNSWATVTPDTGTGNATTVWQATENTGRSSRSVTVYYQTTGGSTTIRRTAIVQQTGASDTVEILTADGSSISSASVTRSNTGLSDTFAIAGTANSSGLGFEVIDISGQETASGWVTLASTITAAGSTETLSNGETSISGDPGSSEEYSWSINVTLAANSAITTRSCTFRVYSTADNSVYDEITIVQSAADAYLRINSTNTDPGAGNEPATVTITIAAAGGSGNTQNIYTFSNTSWEVVQVSD